jgi:uncharacterized low-complexity protein
MPGLGVTLVGETKMSKKNIIKPVALAVGVALAGSFAIGSVASANTVDSPFAMSTLSAGYMMSDAEGSCGGDKQAATDDAKAVEASCGGDKEGSMDEKDAEAHCGGDKESSGEGDKDAEAHCGGDKESSGEGEKDAEASCGGDKAAEASCGGAK